MIWEYRSYDVAHGRLGEEVERMHRVAIAASDKASESSMFDEYGVSRPFSAWTGVAGQGLPIFGYLMQWPSLKQRQKAFPSFWADPRWIEIKNASDDGRPMVQRIDCWIVRQAAGSPQPRARASTSSDAVQELRWIKLANGNQPAARQALAETVIAPLQRAGGEVLSLFDLVIGPKMASCLLFVEWPSLDDCERGNAAAAAPQRADLLRTLSNTILRPVDFATAGTRRAA